MSPRPSSPLSAPAAKTALERSIEALETFLSPDQLIQWRRDRHFDVVGGQTGRRYRIFFGTHSNIAVLNLPGVPARRICFVPAARLPLGDVLLFQKLCLEGDEKATLRIANDQGPQYGDERALDGPDRHDVWIDEAARMPARIAAITATQRRCRDEYMRQEYERLREAPRISGLPSWLF